MIEKEKCTKVGYIQKTHGIKGEVSLSLNEGFFAEDLKSEFLLFDIDNGLVPFYVESLRVKGSKTLFVKLESVEDEPRAKELCGTEVYLENENLVEQEELPTGAYVGFQVIDQKKGDIGTITGLQEISNNPLFILDCEGTEVMFPINPDFILGVDEEEKIMEVDLPEGLIDLYLGEEESEEERDNSDEL
jgi:16S rRNA processing protein RimM